MIVLKLLFFISLAGIVHSYITYGLLMRVLLFFRKKTVSPALTSFPTVEVIFSAFNEEEVIAAKIESLFKTSYPLDKLSVRIGSDASTDQTDAIIRELQAKYPSLHFHPFTERSGKSKIINQLVSKSQAELLILTDANILFAEDTVSELVKSCIHQNATIVGGHIHYQKATKKGISAQENFYLRWENKTKQAESIILGAAMGVEGGCYLIKREAWPVIPPLFFMEDFYVSMAILKNGGKVLMEDRAICYEDVSISTKEEYKRKIRISIGNFQNLGRFWPLLLTRFFGAGFAFLSHKVLRWLTPFFLLILPVTAVFMREDSIYYTYFLVIYGLFLLLGLLGVVFSQNSRIRLLKYPGHFLYMNLALLEGFFIYLKGVKSNAWQPTRRNQE